MGVTRRLRPRTRRAALLLAGAIGISGTARANEVGHVAKADAVVKAAPFEVAADIASLHAGDVVEALEQPRPGWRRVRLSDGRYGVMHEDDLTVEKGQEPPTITPDGPRAQAPASPAPLSPPPPTRRGRASAMFELLPFGTMYGEIPASNGKTTSLDADTAPAWALGLGLDFRVLAHLDIGFAPRMVFHVRNANDDLGRPGKELDLRLRATFHGALSPDISLFLRTGGGFSYVFVPGLDESVHNPYGLVWDVSGGLDRRLAPDTDLVFELGYQFGFQKSTFETSTEGDRRLPARVSALHLGVGLSQHF